MKQSTVGKALVVIGVGMGLYSFLVKNPHQAELFTAKGAVAPATVVSIRDNNDSRYPKAYGTVEFEDSLGKRHVVENEYAEFRRPAVGTQTVVRYYRANPDEGYDVNAIGAQPPKPIESLIGVGVLELSGIFLMLLGRSNRD